MSDVVTPRRTVLQVIPDVEDRETHIVLIDFPGQPDLASYVEITDWIPSRQMYAHGYVVKASRLNSLLKGLRAAKSEIPK